MKVIIDRFEGDFAVVELDVGKFCDLPRVLVPQANVGDVIDITVDSAETERRRQSVNQLIQDLFSD